MFKIEFKLLQALQNVAQGVFITRFEVERVNIHRSNSKKYRSKNYRSKK